MSRNWSEFFDGLAHQSPLYRAQAALYVDALSAAVGLARDARVLDFGCGFGLATELLAARVGEVWWWDSSANMRSVAERNTAHFANVRFCDLSTMHRGRAADEISWHGPVFDAILVNSVVQYMAPGELWAWLPRWRAMLAREGVLVLSDLIPRSHSRIPDIIDLLRLGLRHRSPLRSTNKALGTVAQYRPVSRAVPLPRIDRDDLVRHAADATLDATFLANNLTHFRTRWTAVLRPRTGSDAAPDVFSQKRRTPLPGRPAGQSLLRRRLND